MEGPSQRKTVGVTLLLLAVYMILGVVAAVATVLLKKDEIGFGNGQFVYYFPVNSPDRLNDIFTVIGIYNIGLTYAMSKLAQRIASQIRTRAVLKGIPLKELLNTLPDTPDLKQQFKGLGLRMSLPAVFTTATAIMSGVAYKRGISLGMQTSTVEEHYPLMYPRSCGHGERRLCLANSFADYGIALRDSLNGSMYTLGVQNITDSSRRLTIVSKPEILMRPNLVEFSGEVLALVSDYEITERFREEYSGAVSPLAKKRTKRDPAHLWSFLVGDQSILGDEKWCMVNCTWSLVEGRGWKVTKSELDVKNCAANEVPPLIKPRDNNQVENTRALNSDLIDRLGYSQHENITDRRLKVLSSAYVIPAMYSIQILHEAKFKTVTTNLQNDPNMSRFSPNVKYLVTLKYDVIMTSWPAAAYILTLLVTSFVLNYCGFIDKKTWITTWAPLYIELIRQEQINKIKSQASGGLKLVETRAKVKLASGPVLEVVNTEEKSLMTGD